jgi:hypothetical protein
MPGGWTRGSSGGLGLADAAIENEDLAIRRPRRHGDAPVDESPVLRLFCFRPSESASAFDTTLRTEILPELECLPGLLDGFVGRRGPDQAGERIIVSVWKSMNAMRSGLEDTPRTPRSLRWLQSAVVDSRLDLLPVAVSLRFERAEPPTVLRVLRGALADRLDEYAEEVRTGAMADGTTELGPNALFLGLEPPVRFVTVSAWPRWASVEASTGSDVRNPIATRHSDRIVDYHVDHYETLARLQVQSSPAEVG